MDEEDVRLGELRRGTSVSIVPGFEPALYRSALCDHDSLLECSICGICGYRKWLTDVEEDHGFRMPMTWSDVNRYMRGNLNVRCHSDPGMVPYGRGDEELDRRLEQRAHEDGGFAEQLSERRNELPLDPDEIRKKQEVVDIFCYGWERGMFDEERTQLLKETVSSLGVDYGAGASYGRYNTYGWALCIGSMIPPPLDWGMPLPAWDKGARASELVRAGQVPPRERRMDCLLALHYLYFDWVSRWTC